MLPKKTSSQAGRELQPHINAAVDRGYEGLRQLGQYLRKRHGRRWADATSLVHRAYIRLAEHDQVDCKNLAHARARLSRAMRCCLIDLIRREARCVHVGEGIVFAARSDGEILSVHEGLNSLTQIDPIPAEIVERRYFGGFSWEEISEDMAISVSTAKRKFSRAKAWLRMHFKD